MLLFSGNFVLPWSKVIEIKRELFAYLLEEFKRWKLLLSMSFIIFVYLLGSTWMPKITGVGNLLKNTYG